MKRFRSLLVWMAIHLWNLADWLFHRGFHGSDDWHDMVVSGDIPWEHLTREDREYVRANSWSLELWRGDRR